MSSKPTPPKPRWSIADLIDLEFLLREDKSAEAGRETAFFAEEVEPWIEPEKIERPDPKTLRRAFWRWLQVRKVSLETTKLPGRAISGAFGTVGFGAIILMLFLGAGAVLGTLGYEDARTYNVLLLLAVTVGIQWLFLTIGLLGFLVWSVWRDHAFLTFAHHGFQALIDRIAKRTMSEDAAAWWGETAKTRRLFTLPALELTQAAGIAFNLGALAALVGSVLFVSVRFGWETTADQTMTPALLEASELVATPWSWIDPSWAPTRKQIEGTRIRWDTVDRPGQEVASVSSEESAQAWYAFSVATILVWGLFPRVLLFGIFEIRRRTTIRKLTFAERVHREWWRRMTDVPIEITTKGPADEAIAVLWGGVSPEAEQLHVAALQQLRLNLVETVSAGGVDVSGDDAALKTLARFLKKGDFRIVLVVEAWSLAPKDLGDFLDQLREGTGAKVAIDCFIIGLPRDEIVMTAPKEEEIVVWEKFAASREDPDFFVKPFRAPTWED